MAKKRKKRRRIKAGKLVPLIRSHPFEDPEPIERMLWTSSSVKLFRKCPRKWFWKYFMRLKPQKRAVPLTVGSAFHDALEQWYMTKRASMPKIAAKIVGKLVKQIKTESEYYDQDEHDKLVKEVACVEGMLNGYARSYAADRKRWKLKRSDVEREFKIDMGDFDFAGKIDLLPTIDGKQVILDHKTASKIGASYLDRLPMDTQVRAYIMGALRGLGIDTDKVLYNVVRKTNLRRKSDESMKKFCERIALDYEARPDWYFFREELTFDRDSIAALELEIRQTHACWSWWMKNLCSDAMDPRMWTPHDTTCNEFFKTCPYFRLCTIGLDHGTAHWYKQAERMHTELEAAEGGE
jgi:hypothetical protein